MTGKPEDSGTLGPLAGRRVLVTRAETQAAGLAEALRALGAEVVSLPLAEHLPVEDPGALDTALADLPEWIAFTSANGVRFVADRLHAHGRSLAPLAACRLAVVGSATAQALADRGLAAAIVADPATAAGLADRLGREAPGAITLFQAAGAKPLLADRLRATGWRVNAVVAYRTRPLAVAVSDLGRIDALTVASSATAERLVAALGRNWETLRASGCRCYAIGPETAATMTALGLDPAAIAPTATAQALAWCVAEDLGRR